MRLIAIDPGASGGIAWSVDNCLPACEAMPDTESDICELLHSIVQDVPEVLRPTQCVAIVEDVPVGMPGKGAAMAKLNANAGYIRGVLCALNIRTILVRPAKWQKHYSLGTRSGCKSDSEWKNKLKAEAQRRFPGITVTLAKADALLLLDYHTAGGAE